MIPSLGRDMWGSILLTFILGMLLLALVLGLVLHDLFTIPSIEGALLLHFGADGALLDLAKVLLGVSFLGHDTVILRVAASEVNSYPS